MPKDKRFNPLDRSELLRLNLECVEHQDAFENCLDRILAVFEEADIKSRKTDIKEALKALLLNLILVYKAHPEKYIACSFDKKKGFAGFDNPFGVKVATYRKTVLFLADCGYLELHKGFFDHMSGIGRNTRFKASESLLNILAEYGLIDLERHQNSARLKIVHSYDGIILKDGNKKVVDYREEYDFDDPLQALFLPDRVFLRDYNTLLEATDISLPQEILSKVIEEGAGINLDLKYVHRVFNNNDFNQNGRFNGAWWYYAKSFVRKHIKINGQPTVELDYSSIHPWLCYMKCGDLRHILNMGDAYEVDRRYPRSLVKLAMLMMFNAENTKKAWGALLMKLNNEKMGDFKEHVKTLDGFRALEKAILDAHFPIHECFYTNMSYELMNKDAEIAEHILKEMTYSDPAVPCLSVHDSFIVPEDKEQQLLRAMKEAFPDTHTCYTSPPIKKENGETLYFPNE